MGFVFVQVLLFVLWEIKVTCHGESIPNTGGNFTELCKGKSFLHHVSPRAHLHVVGVLQFMSDINQPSLPTPFYSVLVSISVFMALSTVFHSINSPNNSQFSDSVLPIFMKVSFSPDIIPSG